MGVDATTKAGGKFRLDDLVVDLDRQSVSREGLIELPSLSFRLLAVLLMHAPNPVSKDQLIREVWGEVVVSDETLAQRVRLLRQALGESSQDPKYFTAIRGQGYRMICAVEPLASNGRRLPLRLLAVGAACLVIAAGWFFSREPNEAAPDRIEKIAVLPFADLSANGTYQYFADGMQEELLSRLARLTAVDVASRTSVEAYRSTTKNISRIADELGADAIIEGSVRIDDDRVRITVQLIDARSDTHLFARDFERTLSVQNIFTIQGEVAQEVTNSLSLSPGRVEHGAVSRLPTENMEAYDAFLLGRYHTYRTTPQSLAEAIRFLERATQLDPEFALAYSDLGWAYSFMGTDYGTLAPADAYPKAKEAALRAISLDDGLGTARMLYADILAWHDWDFVAAEREYERALELEPTNVLGYALYLSARERHDEAIALMDRRLEADPDAPFVHVNAAWRYYDARQYAAAVAAAEAAGDHPDARAVLGAALRESGQIERAIAVFEADLATHGRTPNRLAKAAAAYFKNNQPGRGEALLGELEARADASFVSPMLLAEVYFSAGRTEAGFAALNAALDARVRGLIFLRVSHMLDGLRDDPRYLELLAAVGI